MFSLRLRSHVGAGLTVAALIAGTGAGAATLHRYAVTSGTGSGGATTYLESSASGSALQGEVASSPNTSIKIPFGVLGEYNATGSTFGAGTLGISTTGYGVGAESLSATQPSLIALNSSGGPAAQIYGENGGDALDVAGTGGGFGLSVSSDSNNSIYATNSSEYTAIYGENDDGDAGIFGFGGLGNGGGTDSEYGTGLEGYSFDNPGVGVFGEAEYASQGFPAIQAFTGTDGTELFDAGVSDTNTSDSFSVSTVLSSVSANRSATVFTSGVASSDLQINGDIYVTGNVYSNCDDTVPYATSTSTCGDKTAATVRSNSGSKYEMYASEHASKTVEDEGEAVLRGGSAHVALDPAFASVISTREPYLVVMTPEGDTRGVYVTNKTTSGFDVHENGGGRSSVAFDYRIIAHPYGDNVTRMALATAKPKTRGGQSRTTSRALAQHVALLRKINSRQANHRRAKLMKAPPSLVSATSFTTR